MNQKPAFPALDALARMTADEKRKAKENRIVKRLAAACKGNPDVAEALVADAHEASTEDRATYDVQPVKRWHGPDYGLSSADRLTVQAAIAVLDRHLSAESVSCNSPRAVADYLRLHLQTIPHEVFGVLWLDAQHRLIEFDMLFRGTLTQTSVYPREVVKASLHFNAAACILAHNHPSGIADPSRADELLTQELKRCLDLIDVKVLDHIIIAGDKHTSFAERGVL